MEVLISKDLIDSVISYDEFVLINNVLKEYKEMKEEVKILKTFIKDFSLSVKQFYHFFFLQSENPKVSKTKIERIMLLSKCAVCDNSIKQVNIRYKMNEIIYKF